MKISSTFNSGRKKTGKSFFPNKGWVTQNNVQKRDYAEYADSEAWAFLISFFRWYPDVLCDILRSPNAKYKNEELIQRVMLRAFARYQFVDITGCRSLTKTNTKIKQKLVSNILWPNTKSSYYGPSYKQQAELAKMAFRELEEDYPLLTKHYIVAAESKDSFAILTPFGSSLTINAIRGKNIHDVTAEEYAQEEAPAFDFEEYSTVVLFAVRLVHMINGEKDTTFIPYQQHSITSAGRKQNHSYITRCNHMRLMIQGRSAFVMDVPWQIIVLSQMRPYEWAEQRKQETTPEKWMREMESLYTGADENPIVRDEVLAESRKILVMEEHHCCKDSQCKISPTDVIYIIGYDVSYEDNKRNAKCACVVLKLTKQKEFLKRDKYLKQVVWVDDWPPPLTGLAQAKKLKQIWYKYCIEGGNPTYIAIDGWQYGKSVVEALMMDLGDGLNPLCVVNHAQYSELELPNALPVIYPIKAGGQGVTDPDSEMIRNAELQFEHRNVELLTHNRNEGIAAYKKYHKIKDDYLDYMIDIPYKKSRSLCAQIQNLKKVPSGAGISEKRISKAIQRDIWSALKYALRLTQLLEKINLQVQKFRSDWDELLTRYADQNGVQRLDAYRAPLRDGRCPRGRLYK